MSNETEIETPAYKSVGDIPSSQIFTDANEALAEFEKIANTPELQVQFLVYGARYEHDEETDTSTFELPDASTFPSNCVISIRRLDETVENKTKDRGERVPRAIVLHPIPSLQQLMQSSEGAQFVQDAVYSRLENTYISALRPTPKQREAGITLDKINLLERLGTLPVTVTDYISSTRANAADNVFNSLAQSFIEGMKKAPQFKTLRRQIKGIADLRSACSSVAYAKMMHAALEEKSFFETLLHKFISAAETQNLETTRLREMLVNRNSVDLQINLDDTLEALNGMSFD